MTTKKPAAKQAVPKAEAGAADVEAMTVSYGTGADTVTVTVTHSNPSFTGVVTVLETVALPFTNGTATVTVPGSALGAIEALGFDVTFGAPGPAPAYDANLDTLVAPIVGNATSGTAGALRAAYDRGQAAVIYVHPTSGSDSNAGLLRSAPKATIAAALAALPGGKGVVQLALTTHTLTSGITVDASQQTLVGLPGTVLDFSALASGAAITLKGTVTPSYHQVFTALSDLELTGPGSGTSTIGLYFNTAGGSGAMSDAGTPHLSLRNINAHGFGVGHQIGSGAFCLTFTNCTLWGNGVGVYAPAGVTNSGERITYVGCTLYNNIGPAVRAQNGNGAIHLEACSLDYNGSGRAIEINDSHVFLTDCHIECFDSDTSSMVTLAGNSGFMHMQGGKVIANVTGNVTTNPKVAIVENNVDYNAGGCFFDGVYMNNLLTTNGDFSTGTGRTALRNIGNHVVSAKVAKSVGAANNLLADGTMEASGVPDRWFISSDTAAITNRLTGTNINISKSTAQAHAGTQSLKVTKVGGAVSNAQFSLAVPIPSGSKPLWRINWAKPGTQTGTIFLTASAAMLDTTTGAPTILQNGPALKQIGVTLTSAANPWTEFAIDPYHGRAMPWATHFLLVVNLDGMGAGDFFLDDVHVTTI